MPRINTQTQPKQKHTNTNSPTEVQRVDPPGISCRPPQKRQTRLRRDSNLKTEGKSVHNHWKDRRYNRFSKTAVLKIPYKVTTKIIVIPECICDTNESKWHFGLASVTARTLEVNFVVKVVVPEGQGPQF